MTDTDLVAVRAPVIARRSWGGVVVTIASVPSEMNPFLVTPEIADHLVLLAGGSIRLRRRELGDHAFRTMEMRASDVHLARRGGPPFELGWTGGGRGELRAIHVQIEPAMMAQGRFGAAAVSVSPLAPRLLRDPLLEQLIQNLGRTVERPDPSDGDYARAAGQLIALQLLREHARGSGEARVYRGLAPGRLRRLRELMTSRLAGEIRLEELAREAGMSRFHFIRAFKAATGLTPHAYLLHRRIDEARRLLSETDLPFAAIALATGFCSQSHLATRFREVTGSTPSAFRRLR